MTGGWILAAKDQAEGNPAGRKTHLEDALGKFAAQVNPYLSIGLHSL